MDYSVADALKDEKAYLAHLESIPNEQWANEVQDWQRKRFTRQDFIDITKRSIIDLEKTVYRIPTLEMDP